MNCQACGHENQARTKFCTGCGGALAPTCSTCGIQLPPGGRFCGECGTAVEKGEQKSGTVPISGPPADSAPPSGKEGLSRFSPQQYTPKHLADKILTSRSALEGERKQVTVLFADVKGSMDLAEQIDPEEWHWVLNRFFEILSDGVHRFEGTVNQYTGDGIMALFGAPIAHEDHAQRACYAALHLAKELQQYSEELKRTQGLNFAARMGLNSGEVVVGKIGDDLRMDYTAQGHTVGLAARLEQLADPGKIYISDHTAKLVGGFFRLRDLGAFDLKGVRGQMHVHELTDVGEMRTRLDMSRARGLSPFVGRRDEMETLERALEQAVEGNAQVIGLVADAGLGKSRICYEFVEKCRARGMTVNQAHGVAHGKAIPFYPVLQMLRGYFGITEQEPDKTVREKIAGKLLLLDEKFKEALPLVFDFLGVPDPNLPTPNLNPEASQRQLFGVVRRLIHAESAREAGVLLGEDLHWIDGGSEAFVQALIDALPGTRTLVLVNFRPEYHAEWMKKSYYRQIPLQPLSKSAIGDLLKQMLGDDPSLTGLAAHITDRTGGNPYFIEEVIQSMVEDGFLTGSRSAYRLVRPIKDLAIPATVQSLLAARLDRLPEREKQVLQTAAVFGREFSEPVLRQVSDLPETDLADALRKLVAGEFIYEASIYPEIEYAFKHALTQEVVYHSQLSDRRAKTHAAVAGAIAGGDPEKLDERAALIAHHWEQAGENLQAAMWNARAATWAGVRDPGEAVNHWRQVRTLLDSLPESDETTGPDLMARVQLLALGWRQGLTEDEAATLYNEGEALARRTGNVYLHATLKLAYVGYLSLGGKIDESLAVMEDIMRLSEQTGDLGLQLTIESTMCWLLNLSGRTAEGLEFADRAIAREPQDPRAGAEIGGFSPYIQAFTFKAMSLQNLGRYDEAILCIEKAINLARAHGDQEVLGWASNSYAFVEWGTGNDLGALGHSRQGLEIAEKSGSGVSRVMARWGLAMAHMVRKDWETARQIYEEALVISRESRAAVFAQPSLLSMLSVACLELGDGKRAGEAVEESIEILDRVTDRLNEPLAYLALARVLLRTEGAKARARIDTALDRAATISEEIGSRVYLPRVHETRAELAEIRGVRAGRERELLAALRIYEEMNAEGHAARIRKELEA